MADSASALFRLLPKMDRCLAALEGRPELARMPKARIKRLVRQYLDRMRADIAAGRLTDPARLELGSLLPRLAAHVAAGGRPRFRRVLNATGVIVHTNLGRSLMPEAAMAAIAEAGSSYSNLEFDLDSGRRGSRYALVEELLCSLTGAEAALVVNNNAAAVLIVLETLARGREVVVSRGQLVEIGGSFRIPDVMARSGAVLREVGATNRTHLRDYEEAIGDDTALLLKVHNSNYRIVGFTKEVPVEELVALGRRRGLPVVEDLGSGCFVDLGRFGLGREPTVQEVVAAGVDVVTFSGDKLLGGPQAGIILGRRDLLERIKKNPLNRAMRIDKFTLAGLEAVLRLYEDEEAALAQVPTLAMIAAPLDVLEERRRRLTGLLAERGLDRRLEIEPVATVARVGGGAMPERNLESLGLAVRCRETAVHVLVERLRRAEVPLIGRVEEDRLILDLRTIRDHEVAEVADCLAEAAR